MLSSSNINGLINALLFKNGISSTDGNNNIQVGVDNTDLFLEKDIICEGPLLNS